jgi:hypothetical protein
MATQEGPIRIIGTIGDLCFYKSGSQYLVRGKNCNVAVVWEVSDCSTGIICYSTYQSINANSSFNIPNTCCASGNDVYVWLIEVDGVDISAQDADVSLSCLQSQGTQVFATGVTSCLPVAITVTRNCNDVTIQ